jgi:hypothetical protein
VVMVALRRLHLRRLAALHQLLWLLQVVVTAFRRLCLHRCIALSRLLWRPWCVLMTALRRLMILPRPLQSCPSLRMR